MGKLAQGTGVIKLFPGESIVAALSLDEKQIKDLILITNKGYFIKHSSKEIKTSKKGELGTIGINIKDNKKITDKIINCFINNKYVYINMNKERYEKLDTEQINNSLYKKEKKLNIKLNENEFIESTFSILLPKNN